MNAGHLGKADSISVPFGRHPFIYISGEAALRRRHSVGRDWGGERIPLRDFSPAFWFTQQRHLLAQTGLTAGSGWRQAWQHRRLPHSERRVVDEVLTISAWACNSG